MMAQNLKSESNCNDMSLSWSKPLEQVQSDIMLLYFHILFDIMILYVILKLNECNWE